MIIDDRNQFASNGDPGATNWRSANSSANCCSTLTTLDKLGQARCRLAPFKKLFTTIKERFDAVVRGMLDHRSNAFVESMNGQLQQAKLAARE